MGEPEPGRRPKPLRSELDGDPTMRGVVEDFVGQLPERIGVLKEAWERGSDEQLLEMVRGLSESGRGVGYPSISERATELEGAIRHSIGERAGSQSSVIRARLDELVSLCERATCSSD